MTTAVSFDREFTSALARRAAGHEWDSDWLRLCLPRALVRRLSEGGDASLGSTRGLCPFCGESYAETSQRCSTCGGLPVVAPENTRVYEIVLALCGPGCEYYGIGRESASP